MDTIPEKVKCPRCGYEDSGRYCSRCSYDLTRQRENVYQEIYHSLVPKFFRTFPFLGKFIRTWWYSFFVPGKIRLKDTYVEDTRFLTDIKYATTLYYFSLGSALTKSMFMIETTSLGGLFKVIERFITDLLTQSYILWIFGFILIAYIWTGRIWTKWMKIKLDDQRRHDSFFVYEFGTQLTIVLVFFLMTDYKFEFKQFSDPNVEVQKFMPTLILWEGIIGLRLLYFLIVVGIREKLAIIRLIFISIATVLVSFVILIVAEIITMPIILVPILVLFSPFFYLGRYLYKILKTLLQSGMQKLKRSMVTHE